MSLQEVVDSGMFKRTVKRFTELDFDNMDYKNLRANSMMLSDEIGEYTERLATMIAKIILIGEDLIVLKAQNLEGPRERERLLRIQEKQKYITIQHHECTFRHLCLSKLNEISRKLEKKLLDECVTRYM